MSTMRYIYIGGEIPTYAHLVHESLIQQAEDARHYLENQYLVPYQLDVPAAHYKELPYTELVKQTLPAFVKHLSKVDWGPLLAEYDDLPKSAAGESELTVGINFTEEMDDACQKIVNYVRNTGTRVLYIYKGKTPNYRKCATLSPFNPITISAATANSPVNCWSLWRSL